MSEKVRDKVYSNILYDLDTIRIERVCIDDPEKSYELLKLLKEFSIIVSERFGEVRGE